jgi:hypothetical protein
MPGYRLLTRRGSIEVPMLRELRVAGFFYDVVAVLVRVSVV